MKTQTKKISLQVILNLVTYGTLVNNNTNRVLSHSIFRYENNIEQETLFAIETLEGDLEIMPNDTVTPLLLKLNISTDEIYKRKLKLLNFNICILSPESSEPERSLFRILTGK